MGEEVVVTFRTNIVAEGVDAYCHEAPLFGEPFSRFLLPAREAKVPEIDPEIDAVLLLNSTSGEIRVAFVSPSCGGNQASELWWETGTLHYVLYHQDEFYDDLLRDRRNSGNMISPRDPLNRMHYVGNVWGVIPAEMGEIVMARARLCPIN